MSMNDAQLAAWRAKRTGKAVPTNNAGDSNRGPDAAIVPRSPLDGMTMDNGDPAFVIPSGNADPDPAPAFNPTLPAVDPQVQNQLDAALGRLAPLQRQNEELKAALEAQQRATATMQAQMADLQNAQQTAAAQTAAANFNPFEGLDAEQIDMLDPTSRAIVEAAARNAFTKASNGFKDPEALITKALAARDEKAKIDYIRTTAAATGLVALSNDTKFNAFLREDDSANFLLNSFINAADVETARSLEPNLRKMLKRYEKTTNTRTPDPHDQMSAHLSRTPGASGSANGQPAKAATSPEEARTIRNRAAQLTRARKFKEADALLASINN